MIPPLRTRRAADLGSGLRCVPMPCCAPVRAVAVNDPGQVVDHFHIGAAPSSGDRRRPRLLSPAGVTLYRLPPTKTLSDMTRS